MRRRHTHSYKYDVTSVPFANPSFWQTRRLKPANYIQLERAMSSSSAVTHLWVCQFMWVNCVLDKIWNAVPVNIMRSRHWVHCSQVGNCSKLILWNIPALFAYDIVLTFSTEVEKIWRRRFTGVTVLWFLVREHDISEDGLMIWWTDPRKESLVISMCSDTIICR